ncbi:hypothetical protein EVAR_34010_1 [Eumeta japonica]|uniref:Uncharacterized protein n=1 Tax=Eumeta variegata TaxID=151549 RepID=A0A4C1VR51_EUMVA|nr:hypothetical protein EVAR_34010_1 [Eumeta japonica]
MGMDLESFASTRCRKTSSAMQFLELKVIFKALSKCQRNTLHPHDTEKIYTQESAIKRPKYKFNDKLFVHEIGTPTINRHHVFGREDRARRRRRRSTPARRPITDGCDENNTARAIGEFIVFIIHTTEAILYLIRESKNIFNNGRRGVPSAAGRTECEIARVVFLQIEGCVPGALRDDRGRAEGCQRPTSMRKQHPRPTAQCGEVRDEKI